MSTFTTPKGTVLPLLKLKRKDSLQDYLQVAHRLVWFREEHPTWSISTHLVDSSASHAFFKAVIQDENGRVLSTAHKFEDKQGFADFREKAETGSIGRALALVGYGTQFCADELDEGSRLVDAPTQPAVISAPMSSAKATVRVSPVNSLPKNGNTDEKTGMIYAGKYQRKMPYEVARHDLEAERDRLGRLPGEANLKAFTVIDEFLKYSEADPVLEGTPKDFLNEEQPNQFTEPPKDWKKVIKK